MSLLLSGVWPSTVEGWVGLISLIIGLVGAVVALIPTAIKCFKALKEIAKNHDWKKIMEIADAAMKDVEGSKKSGKKKLETVISAVKAGCAEAGIEIDDKLLEDLTKYINECIEWHNGMNEKNNKK